MNKSMLAVLTVAVLVVAGTGVAVYAMQGGDDDNRDKITVTMSWEKSIVQDIVGDHYKVVSMLGSNVSPHEAYSTPSNIADLNTSKLYFKIGSGVEWETAFFEAIEGTVPSTVKIVDLADKVDYTPLANTHHHHHHDGDDDDDDEDEHDHEEGEHGEEEHEHEHGEEEHEHEHESANDAHIWTSPTILRGIAKCITDSVCDLDPSHAAEYRANLDAYYAKVDKVDTLMTEVARLAGPEHTHVLVWHPAWQYLLNQYSREARFGAELCQESVEADGEVTASEAAVIMTTKGFKSIYLSVNDDGYEGRAAITDAGLTVHVVNPTSDDMLASITEFLGFLKDDLSQKA